MTPFDIIQREELRLAEYQAALNTLVDLFQIEYQEVINDYMATKLKQQILPQIELILLNFPYNLTIKDLLIYAYNEVNYDMVFRVFQKYIDYMSPEDQIEYYKRHTIALQDEPDPLIDTSSN